MELISINKVNEIINEVYNQSGESYLKMTTSYYISKIRDLSYHEFYKVNNMNIDYVIQPHNVKTIENILSKAYLKFMKPHIEDMRRKIAYMDSIPLIEQRTQEWFDQRNNLLSASSIYKVLGSESGIKELLFEKIGIAKEFTQSAPTIHGTVFEIVSQTVYESRNNITIKEYGCIPHPSHNFIGASPDGLVYNINHIDMHSIDLNDEDLQVDSRVKMDDISLFGRLLEIKNPYSRSITNIIPSHYEKQVITQEEVCGIPHCDFLEMNYNFYDNINEFLKDVFEFDTLKDLSLKEQDNFIKNHNIPLCNLCRNGVEKGILLKIEKPGGKFEGMLYDLNTPYNKEDIQKWIAENQLMIKNGKAINIEVKYFNINDYDIKTHFFNNYNWKTIYESAKNVWSRILEERLMSDEQIKEKYKELVYSVSNNCDMTPDNSKKRKSTTKYQLRNLMKKPKHEKVLYKF